MTINTQEGLPLFGTIVNGRMVLSETGRVAAECWRNIPRHFPNAQLGEYVIMPNHMHGILKLVRGPIPADPPALGDVVGAYKAAVSRIIGRGRQLAGTGRQLPTRTIAAGASAIWHRNYWDVIVRDEIALTNIRHYIRTNPRNYDVVMNVGEPRFVGNRAIWDMPKLGFLASRGAAMLQGRLPIKPGEAIVSGFLSPMERAVFKSSLQHNKHVIWVKPWGLNEEAPSVRLAIQAGRLLLVSPFDEKIEAPSARRAVWCNQYVLAHCDRLVVGHLNPGGMLTCILSEADPGMEITHLGTSGNGLMGQQVPCEEDGGT